MGEKKGEDVYCNFSRKDIQGLCKKYGLPANKSNFEMATSLILYLEKKNLNSRTMWEAARSDPCPSGTSELGVGAGMITIGDQRKDCRGAASHNGSGNKRHDNQDVQQNDSQNFRGIVTSDKASENAGVLTHLHMDSINGVSLPENTFSSVVSSPVAARSSDFQFDVRSEDGIQLCVDLNSTPSDWIERMKSEVHVCQCHDVHGCRSQDLQQDLGLFCSKQLKISTLVDSDKEMNNGNSKNGSSPTTTGTGIQKQVGEPDVVEGSLCSAQLKSCSNTVLSQENTGGRQAMSSTMESNGEKEVSGAKSCEREGKTVPTGSTINAVTQIRTCNVLRNSCDLMHSGMSANHVLNVGNDIYANSSVQQMNDLLNPPLKYMVPASGSVEVKPSPCTTLVHNVAPPSETGTSMDLTDQLQFAEREHCGFHQSTQFHGNLHQLQSFEGADVSRYVTFSSKSGNIEDEHCRASVSSKSSGQVTGLQTHQATCHRENMSLFPSKRYRSLGIVHLTNNIETENDGFLRQREPGEEAVDVHSSMVGIGREGTLLFPCGNGVSLDLVVSEQHGLDCCILTCTNEVDQENHRSHPTSVGNLGKSNVGGGKKSSECLDGDLMEKICMRPPNSECNGELKRNREFNSIEDQSNCFNSDSRISRTSKQFSGDAHASRRRSSRLFTK